jgi:hypothetical protein
VKLRPHAEIPLETFEIARFIQHFRGTTLDTQAIIAELEAQLENITQAIAALRGGKAERRKPGHGNKGRHLSPAARKRISAAMKKRWAERKKKAA